MSLPIPENLRPHDLAKAEIDGWRGRCLNTFARAEKAVTETLAKVRESESKTLLEPLAGQRLNALDKLACEHRATDAQRAGLKSALSAWRFLDVKRPFFSHGIVTELTGRAGQWHVQLDFIAVRKGVSEAQRLNLSKSEALAFEEQLHAAFKALSSHLGQLRKRLEPHGSAPNLAELKKPDPGSIPG